jgi:hypothetical protein
MPMKKSIDHITQASLLEELRIKSSAIDSAVNGIVFGDLEGRVTYGNAAAEGGMRCNSREVALSSASRDNSINASNFTLFVFS